MAYVIWYSLPSGMKNIGMLVTNVACATCPNQNLQRKPEGILVKLGMLV